MPSPQNPNSVSGRGELRHCCGRAVTMASAFGVGMRSQCRNPLRIAAHKGHSSTGGTAQWLVAHVFPLRGKRKPGFGFRPSRTHHHSEEPRKQYPRKSKATSTVTGVHIASTRQNNQHGKGIPYAFLHRRFATQLTLCAPGE